jgi:hypothetical protein
MSCYAPLKASFRQFKELASMKYEAIRNPKQRFNYISYNAQWYVMVAKYPLNPLPKNRHECIVKKYEQSEGRIGILKV